MLSAFYCNTNFIRSFYEIDVIFHKKIKTEFYLYNLRCIIILDIIVKSFKIFNIKTKVKRGMRIWKLF